MLTDHVRVRIPLLIQPDNEPVPAWWVYDPADPYAVQIDFHDGYDDPVWSFARDLVRQGLRQPAGLGDVRLWPHDGQLWLTIEGHDGKATFTTSRSEVGSFLAATYQAVPRGQEAVDVDAAIARLLGAER